MVSKVSSSRYCKACGAANPAQATHCSVCFEPFVTAQAGPATNPLTGLLLPNVLLKQRYHILDVLSTDETYTVYKAEDMQLGRRVVALKEIGQSQPAAQADEEKSEAGRREMLLQAGLVHPNLPRVYDAFMENQRWYFVMDLLAGETLAEYLSKKRGRGLPLEEVMDIGIQLSTVLDYLHSRQVPLGFNDLSLSSILRAPAGKLSLLDVGEPLQTIETPAGAPMYGLGMLLRQLQAPGKALRRGKRRQFRLPLPRRHRWHPQSSAFNLLIEQMTLKDVKLRPASMGVVRQELQHLAMQDTVQTRKGRFFSRRTILKAVSWATLMAVSAGATWFVEEQFHRGAQPPLTPAYSPGLGGTIYTYSDAPVNGWLLALAWSPTGRRIVVSGPDADLQVWDANTGKHLVHYTGHQKTVEMLSWSAQNNLIASGSDDLTVRIWDGTTGKSRLVYRGHTKPVVAVAWSPDGRYIASGAYDRTVQVWDVATGRQIITYHGHAAGIGSVAWSPDGRYIASASYDSTVQVWEAVTGRMVFTYAGHTDKVYTVAWSPDGKYIASGGSDQSVRVWSALESGKAGRPPQGWYGVYSGHSDAVEIVAWSPDGRTIASGGDDTTVQLWNGLTGKQIYSYNKHAGAVYTLGWSPNGKYIASAGKDGTAQVWNATNARH